MFDLQSAIKAFVSKLQIPREEAEAYRYSYFRHCKGFTATMDIDFHEVLDLIEEKQDLLDYLQNMAENMNARFLDLITELWVFWSFRSKLIQSAVVLLLLKWQNYTQTTKQKWTFMCIEK